MEYPRSFVGRLLGNTCDGAMHDDDDDADGSTGPKGREGHVDGVRSV